MIWKPAKQANNYPLDLDGGEKFTRFRTGISPWPYPSIIGCINGFIPLQDAWVRRRMIGRAPMGPNVSTVPVNLQQQMTIPGLAKSG